MVLKVRESNSLRTKNSSCAWERDEHLEISGNIEGHGSGGVDDIEDREVEAKGQHSRP